MQVIILGSGSPIPDPERAGPSTLVRTSIGDLLFDCGRGVLMRAAAAGSGAGAFQALLLTHLHSDHITDLNDVFTMRWVMSFSPNPLPVFGPSGTARLLHATEDATLAVHVTDGIEAEATGVCGTAEGAQRLEEELRAMASVAAAAIVIMRLRQRLLNVSLKAYRK